MPERGLKVGSGPLSLWRPLWEKEVGLKNRKLNQTRFTLETTGEDKKGFFDGLDLGVGVGLSSWLETLIIVTLL